VKRLLVVSLLGAAVLVPSAVAAPPSGTGTLSGIVIAKDRPRHALVVARPSGVAQMLVASDSAFRTRVGSRVVIHFGTVPGGLPSVQSVASTGHARRAVVHGTIVRLARQRVVLNAGGSLLGVRLRASAGQRTLAAVGGGPSPHVGDDVTVDVPIDGNGSIGTATILDSASTGGQDDSGGEMEVHGIVSALAPATPSAAGSITVTVHGLAVSCAIPMGAQVRAASGESVEIKCELAGDPGAWTLRKASGEDDDSEHAGDGGHGEHHGGGGHGDNGDDDGGEDD
jgi:hypothetical protein